MQSDNNGSERGPLYPHRTFFFDPYDPRGPKVCIEIEVQDDWVINGPPNTLGGSKGSSQNIPAGIYKLEFVRNSPQPLVRVTIDPDPGGGKYP